MTDAERRGREGVGKEEKKKEREWIHMTADRSKKGRSPLYVVPAHSVCSAFFHDLSAVCALLLSLCAVCLQSLTISAHMYVLLLKKIIIL